MGHVEQNTGKKHLTPEELEYRALALRAIGWLLVAVDSIIVVFIFVGFRDGSDLWLYWAVVEGLVGIGMIAAGRRREQEANIAMAKQVQAHLPARGNAEQEKAA